ncbi:MAG: restriction endonuclease subunit S [Bacteroidales bacterium]|nr:restriction endonuclease subunit S [Bacteroidales bacterium]
MSEWKKVKLGEICGRVTSGGTPKANVSSYYNPPTIPWLKTKEVNYCRITETENYISEEGLKNSSAKLISPNSVIIAMYGQGDTAGRVAINKIPLATNQACCNLTIDKSKADYEFIYYQLCTLYDKLVSLKAGAAQPNLNARIIKKLEITMPSLPNQRRIATILSRYDSLIENHQKQIKLLEEAAQRLYKEWFVDLHFPGHENTKIVDGVPEGWEKKKVGEVIVKVPRSKQIPTKDYQKEGAIPIIDQSRDYIAGYTDDIESRVESNEPYIVFGDHTRILKYVPFPFAKGADGTQLIMSNDLDLMPQCLLFTSLVSVDLSNYSYARHFKYLKEEEILVPTASIANAFSKHVAKWYAKIQLNREQLRLLTEARDRLLPKLMSGEIEI